MPGRKERTILRCPLQPGQVRARIAPHRSSRRSGWMILTQTTSFIRKLRLCRSAGRSYTHASGSIQQPRGNMRILSFLLLIITGLGMALPGAYLAMLGGSLYYLIAGVGVLVSAWLLMRQPLWGICLFWL